jgi:glycosyltransferase involved in cell wall biosynthesis
VDGLVAACERLLADRSLRRRLGSAAAHAIRTKYTWDGNAARVERLASTLRAPREVAA